MLHCDIWLRTQQTMQHRRIVNAIEPPSPMLFTSALILDQKRKRTELYKTSLCAHFRESGLCPFAENCSFAHGEMELRSATQGDFTEADCTEADFTEADFTEADYTEAVEGVPPAW